jgi:hypothetical protein
MPLQLLCGPKGCSEQCLLSMANPRDAKAPTALGHTLGYNAIPGWPSGGVGGAELHIGSASIKQPSRTVDAETMQAIVDARWALTLRERVNPVRERLLFERRSSSAAAAQLAQLARQPYGQRSAALYPPPAAALPRSASAAAIRTREPDRRNTLTGDGMQDNEGFDIRDGLGGGRNGTLYNHALWRDGAGRKPAPGKSAPYSWRNYAVDGPSEVGSAKKAMGQRSTAVQAANKARAGEGLTRGGSIPGRVHAGAGDAIAKETGLGNGSACSAPRLGKRNVRSAAEVQPGAECHSGAKSQPGGQMQSDIEPFDHDSATGAAPAQRRLGVSASLPSFLGWSAPKAGMSSGGAGGDSGGGGGGISGSNIGVEGGCGSGGGGGGGGGASTSQGGSVIGCASELRRSAGGSAIGTISELRRYDELGESASQLSRGWTEPSVLLLGEMGAPQASSQVGGGGGRGDASHVSFRKRAVASQLSGVGGRGDASQVSFGGRSGASQLGCGGGRDVTAQVSGGGGAREVDSQLGGARIRGSASQLSRSRTDVASGKHATAVAAASALSVCGRNTNGATGNHSGGEPIAPAAQVHTSKSGGKGSAVGGRGGEGGADEYTERRQSRGKAKAAAAAAAERKERAEADAAFAFLRARARNMVESRCLPPPTKSELGSLEYQILLERQKAATARRKLEAPDAARPPWVCDGEQGSRRPLAAGRPGQAGGGVLDGHSSSPNVTASGAHAEAGGTRRGTAPLGHLRPSSLQPSPTEDHPSSKHDHYTQCAPIAHPPNPKIDIEAPAGARASAASFAHRGPAWH